MIEAVQVLDALQGRAYQLYKLTGALDSMNAPAPSASEVDLEKQSKQTTEEILESIRNPEAFHNSTLRMPRKKVIPSPTSPEVGDEDLIDMSLREYDSASSYRQNRSDTHPSTQPKGKDDHGIKTIHGL